MYDDEQGPKAIQALQALGGIEITFEEARDGRPGHGECGWLKMSDGDKQATTHAHKAVCGGFDG